MIMKLNFNSLKSVVLDAELTRLRFPEVSFYSFIVIINQFIDNCKLKFIRRLEWYTILQVETRVELIVLSIT